jgi:hypothetical protein
VFSLGNLPNPIPQRKALPMAQKYITQIVDDLDGTVLEEDKAETINFAVDGTQYAIDLSLEHAKDFRTAVEKFTAAARYAGKQPTAKSTATKSKTKTGGSEDLMAIREWANQNGYNVSSRGRIPGNVQKAYADAH